MDSSTVSKRLLAAGRKSRSPCEKQLLTVATKKKKKRLKWGKKYKKRGKDKWRKVALQMRAILKCMDANPNL